MLVDQLRRQRNKPRVGDARSNNDIRICIQLYDIVAPILKYLEGFLLFIDHTSTICLQVSKCPSELGFIGQPALS